MQDVLDLDELPEVEQDDDEEKHMRLQEVVSCQNHIHKLVVHICLERAYIYIMRL